MSEPQLAGEHRRAPPTASRRPRASPSLLRYARSYLPEAYADARERALAETGLPPNTFPTACSYTLDQALDPKSIPD